MKLKNLKVRIWNMKKKEYPVPTEIMWINDTLYYINLYKATKTKFKLEMFTGVCDKDGVEIYEGDIVKRVRLIENLFDPEETLHPHQEVRHLGKISLTQTKGIVINGRKFSREISDVLGTADLESGVSKYYGNPGGYSKFSRVIGNINQNPELMNEPLITKNGKIGVNDA